MPNVLVIDDDRMVLRLFEKAVQETDTEVRVAASGREGLSAIRDHSPDVLFLDISLPDTSGLDLVGHARGLDPNLPIAFITVSDDSHTAIEAMRSGAFDYLVKPLSIDGVQRLVRRALDTRKLSESRLAIGDGESTAVEEEYTLLGHSPAILEVYKEIGRIAPQDVAVLIYGESGTGKELVARAIYRHSSRCGKCFLSVNCAAITDTLLESELFGHEKGSFTGADRRRLGKFEQCYGGTIFLDEVGDMSPAAQSKVLRLIEEQQFQRVGGNETIKTDVRIISATNRDLKKMIEAGQFRADLYHRLHGYRIDLPPLRERGEDIALLAGHFLGRFRKELGKDIKGVSPDAMELLMHYSWPGNIRELQTTLRTTVLKTPGPVVAVEILRDALDAVHPTTADDGDAPLADSLAQFVDDRENTGSHNLYAETLQMMEHYLIQRVLRENHGNQSKAAERLGITRGTLRAKIRALGLAALPLAQTRV